MPVYLQILRERGTPRLVLAALTARIPDAVAATAIVVLVRATTGSYPAAGAAAGAFGIGTAVSAPLAGRALDRLGQRRVLPVLAAAFGAVLTVLLASAGHLPAAALAVLAALAGMTRPPVEAGLRALWPRLVPAAALDAAYALDSTVQEIIWIAGPLMLAVLLAAGGPRLPLLACALLSVAGTAAYALSPRLPAVRGRGRRPGGGPLRSPVLRVLLGAAACYGIGVGILNLALVAYAAGHGGTAWVGVLVAVWGAGSLAGGVAYGSRRWRAPVQWRAAGCLAAFGAALLPLAAAPGLAVLALLLIVAGVPLAPWLGSLSAAVQRAVPSAAVAEAFTWSFYAVTVGTAAGSAAGGALIEAGGPRAGFLAAGGLCLVGAAAGLLPAGRGQRPRVT